MAKIWTEDPSELVSDWRNFFPWEEEKNSPEQINATTRLILYSTAIAYALRRNPLHIKYGLGVLICYMILEKGNQRALQAQEDHLSDKIPPDSNRANEVVDLTDNPTLYDRILSGSREIENRPKRIPTQKEWIFGKRMARKSASEDDDELFARQNVGSVKFASSRKNLNV